MKKVLQYGMTPNYGGVEAFIMNIYRQIDHSKLQFDFFVEQDKKISYEDEIISLGGNFIHQKYHSRKYHPIKHYRELVQYFKENKKDLIAVHINKANIRDIDLLIIAKLMKVPIRILHSHTCNPNGLQFMEKINQKLLGLITTHLFACSEEAGKYLFGNKKFTIIPNAIDIDMYRFNKANRQKIRQELHISDDEFIVGSIGRFSREKNTLFTIDVFNNIHKKNPKSKLLLIGDGPLKEEVNEKITVENLTKHVILTGTKTDVYKYYSAMDVFLLPSLYEGFGMVLLEAQINGLNCIASKDVIPSSVNISGEVEYVSLAKNAKIWADSVLKYQNSFRYNKVDEFQKNGFDSKTAALKLQNIYFNKGEIDEPK